MKRQILIKNFSQNAETYDQYATVQKKCANELLAFIPQNDYKTILEIGCGTGIFTSLLKEKFANARITSIDISPDMIEIAKKRFPENKIDFLKANIEDLKIENKFDFVTGNVSLHWASDFKEAIKRMSQHVSDKGVMAFSVYGPGTFNELNHVLSVLYGENKWLSSTSFKEKNEVNDILSNYFNSLEISEYNVQLIYPDIWTYLYSIKKTGTQGDGIGKFITLTKNKILQIQTKYLELYGQIKATHNIFFCKGTRA